MSEESIEHIANSNTNFAPTVTDDHSSREINFSWALLNKK